MSEQHPILSVAYAYSPRERSGCFGGYHIVTSTSIEAGRLKREPRDALCKPRAKFWSLDGRPGATPNCARCMEIAQRHGWRVPVTPGATTAQLEWCRKVLTWAHRPKNRARIERVMALLPDVTSPTARPE